MTTQTTIAEKTGHRQVSVWKGDEPGSCGFECSCGDVFDGFDTIAEAMACHRALEVEPVAAVDVPKPAPKPDPRTDYIAGLRMFADLLEQHPDLLVPHGYISVVPLGEQQSREQLAAWARALPGKKDKEINDTFANLNGSLRGLKVKVVAYRDEVCEKVVLGTREVTEEVPDPDAPKVTVTRTVEDVEWVCRAMLAGDAPERVGAAS